jgi:uncharacterized protein
MPGLSSHMLRERITDDLKEAMRGGDTRRRDALRLLTASLKQKEVDERKAMHDADIVAVIEKMIKQRRDSIKQFEQGSRPDLVEQEEFEISVLERYMPDALSPGEIDAAIDAAIAEAGAKTPSDMGKVMGSLKARLAGRADMAEVSARVKRRLTR